MENDELLNQLYPRVMRSSLVCALLAPAPWRPSGPGAEVTLYVLRGMRLRRAGGRARPYARHMIIIARVIQVLSYLLIADILLRWVQRPSQVPLRWTYELTEPIYAQLRKVIPPVAGLDLSPLFLIFGLQGLSWLLWQALG